MTELSFTQENMPEPEEFQQMLTEAMAETSPVDSLLELVIELSKYERQYGMTSAEFIQRYQRGELGDDPDTLPGGQRQPDLPLRQRAAPSKDFDASAPQTHTNWRRAGRTTRPERRTA